VAPSRVQRIPRWLRGAILVVVALLVVDGLVLAGAWALHSTVVPSWKKGPLIDPTAPYAPEQAILLFGWAACGIVDLYVLLLVLSRRLAPLRGRWWIPWAALVVSVAAAEGGVQLWLQRNMVTYFRPHPSLHWVVRSNLKNFQNVTGGGTISTNADGMRDVTVSKKKLPDEYRILVLGDSSNFGHGVEGDEVFSADLERLMEGHVRSRKVEVLNGACPGWTTYQAVRFLSETGMAYGPDLVIAGFNNDSGPDYFGDSARAPAPFLRLVEGPLFKSEVFLLGRETFLSTLRRAFPTPEVPYTARNAGADPKYGKLEDEESAGLVPRVSLDEFVGNLRSLHAIAGQGNAGFVWLNMPVNRLEPEYVDRYVSPAYRSRAAEVARDDGFFLIDVDARWTLTREYGLHQYHHVFHPSVKGHLRLAEQVAHELLSENIVPGAQGDVPIEGPPPAADEATLRFGWSSFTPVHAHVGAVLTAHPEIAQKYGIKLDLHAYTSGGPQGQDSEKGLLDAFFTCEVPAVQMLSARPDMRIVASPGSLGRIAVVAHTGEIRSLRDLRGRKVGLAQGSTPAMDWQSWGEGLDATVVPLQTDDLLSSLLGRTVDAVVGWDPWVERWIQDGAGHLSVVAERPFRSDLAVGLIWAVYEPDRTKQLVRMVAEALSVAAADRPRWDAEVARLSGWPVGVVKAVADRNDILAGRTAVVGDGSDLAMTNDDGATLGRAIQFLHRADLSLDYLLGPQLLSGKVPELRVENRGQGKEGPFSGGKGPPSGGKGPPSGGKGPPSGGKGPPSGGAGAASEKTSTEP
jgi:ABC-type nitrate/sulfonate/bicarbonate transport system substrate-binding protein